MSFDSIFGHQCWKSLWIILSLLKANVRGETLKLYSTKKQQQCVCWYIDRYSFVVIVLCMDSLDCFRCSIKPLEWALICPCFAPNALTNMLTSIYSWSNTIRIGKRESFVNFLSSCLASTLLVKDVDKFLLNKLFKVILENNEGHVSSKPLPLIAT